jgi:hypothetical protein
MLDNDIDYRDLVKVGDVASFNGLSEKWVVMFVSKEEIKLAPAQGKDSLNAGQ